MFTKLSSIKFFKKYFSFKIFFCRALQAVKNGTTALPWQKAVENTEYVALL
jgi:hypothetical protein